MVGVLAQDKSSAKSIKSAVTVGTIFESVQVEDVYEDSYVQKNVTFNTGSKYSFGSFRGSDDVLVTNFINQIDDEEYLQFLEECENNGMIDSSEFRDGKFSFLDKLSSFQDMIPEILQMLKDMFDTEKVVTKTVTEIVKVKVQSKANFKEFIAF
jgi:nicotinic acid phosphoribosyltransferase